ncbi:MAG: hypothetical protein KDB60_15200 [Propionibacteriaceae bacterium]|nr:hypothetical protein [Propionibacteriaceae bacterium]
MSLSQAQKNYWTGAIVVGAVIAVLFGILAGNSAGGNQTAYIGAAVVGGVIAVGSLIVLLTRR